MRYISYDTVKRIRFFTLVLSLFLFCISAFKLYYDYSKIRYVKMGEACFIQGNVVSAEGWFVKAEDQRFFHYNEPLIDDRLEKLKYVTELKQFMKDIANTSKSAYKSRDIKALVAQYDSYMNKLKSVLKSGGKVKEVFQEISKNYSIDDNYKKYFETIKSGLISQAQANIKNKKFNNEDFKKQIFLIPSQYFGGEDKKKQNIEGLLKKYSNDKIDILAKGGNVSGTIAEASDTIECFSQNKSSYKWLLDKMESLWGDTVKQDISIEDYSMLYEHYMKYSSFIKNYIKKSKVLTTVDQKINNDYNIAMRLFYNGKYQQSIELLNNLSKFKDTKKEINTAKLKWMESTPDAALKQAFPDKKIKLSKSGKNLFGVPVYIIACDDTNQVYLMKISDDCSFTNLQSKVIDDNREITDIDVLNNMINDSPAILVKTNSDKRKAGYAAFTVSNDSLKEILNIEADSMRIEEKGRVLVDNPVGQGEGKLCYYTLNESGRYVFSETKNDYTEITLDSISQYFGQKVGFECSIAEYDSNQKRAVAYYGRYVVVLKNIDGPITGDVYIIGRYDSNSQILNDNVSENVPCVSVNDIKKK